MKTKKILIDANVLIAANYPLDSLHASSIKLLESIVENIVIVNYLIISEIATVLLLRSKNISFVSKLIEKILRGKNVSLGITVISSKIFSQILEVFSHQKSHKLSIPDCSIIAQARLEKIDTIATFDKDLRKEFKDEFNFLPKRLPKLV